MKKFIFLTVIALTVVLNVNGGDEPLSKKAKFTLRRTDDDQRVMMATVRLHEVCRNDRNIQSGGIRFLIEEGADVNHFDLYGFTPIYYAVVHGNEKRVKQLCRSGKINMSAKYGSDEESILHTAVLSPNSKNIIKCLLKTEVPIDAVDRDQENAAHYAMGEDNFAVANLLAERGINLTQKNCDGEMPIDSVDQSSVKSNYLLNKQIRALTFKQIRNSK